jgi:hypothetical protein
MKHLTKILGTTLLLWAALATVAAATSLAVTSTVLSAGNSAVASCGVASASATRSVDNSGNVTGVTVSNVPAACQGKTLLVTLTAQNGSALGGTSGTVSSCTTTCTVTLSGFGTVSASNLYGYAFAVTG